MSSNCDCCGREHQLPGWWCSSCAEYFAKDQLLLDEYWAKARPYDDDYTAKEKILDDARWEKLKLLGYRDVSYQYDNKHPAECAAIDKEYRTKHDALYTKYWAKVEGWYWELTAKRNALHTGRKEGIGKSLARECPKRE